MKIVTKNISMAEELDREALTGIRGGIAPQQCELTPWRSDFPQLPSFPRGFPFTCPNPAGDPALFDPPANPTLQ